MTALVKLSVLLMLNQQSVLYMCMYTHTQFINSDNLIIYQNKGVFAFNVVIHSHSFSPFIPP